MDYSLKAVFGMDATGFKSEIKSLRTEVTGFVDKWGSLGLAAAGTAFVALGKNVMDLASGLRHTSESLNINVESLQALQRVARANGIEEEALAKTVEKMRGAVAKAADGQKTYTDALAQLHLKTSDLLKLPVDKQYAAIAQAVAKAKDQNEAFNAVVTIFGDDAGPKMMQSLRDIGQQGLPALVKSAKDAGQVLDAETVVALEKAETAIGNFKRAAEVAVGNIIVNFRTEEGMKLLTLQFMKVVGTFGAGIVDALANAASIGGAAMQGMLNWSANYFGEQLVDAVRKVSTVINAILHPFQTIGVRLLGWDEGLAKVKASGKNLTDSITEAIAMSKPITFKRDVADYWDRAIADQQKVVDALNKVDFGKEAKKLTDAGKSVQHSITQGAETAAKTLHDSGDEQSSEVKWATDYLKDGMHTASTELFENSQKAYNILMEVARTFSGMFIKMEHVGTPYTQQSTAALQGVLKKLEDQINAYDPQSGGLVKNADINTNYGTYLQANFLRNEIGNVEKELQQRAQVSAYASRYGEDAARTQYGDDLVNRAVQDMTSTAAQTNVMLSQLSRQLAASGIFPPAQ